MDLSIIIVSWNTRDILRNCLTSVYANADDLQLEVIVIDNASSDGSVEMVREEFGHVRLVTNTENKGFAAANNQGMRLAKGRYVLLLNSDTIVLKGALKKAVSFANSWPDAGVVGCRVLNPEGTLQRSCFMFPSLVNMMLSASYLYKLLPGNRFFGRERMTWWDFDCATTVDAVMGCFMLVRRQAIDTVGMMDEQFFMYAEETDWCMRMRRAGWKVYFTPDSQIIHLGGQSSAKVRGAMIIQLRLSILKLIRKHYSRATYIFACMLVGLFFAVRVPYWWAVSLFEKGTRREQAYVRLQAYIRGAMEVLGAKAAS